MTARDQRVRVMHARAAEQKKAELWNHGLLPIRDGLYKSSGEAYAVRLDPAVPGGLEILDAFDLDALLSADPDRVTSIDVTRELETLDGYLCCGEGPHGSEGFFARLDRAKNLVWVVYLEESNPFVDIAVSDTTATFTSSSGVQVTVVVHEGSPVEPDVYQGSPHERRRGGGRPNRDWERGSSGL